MGVQHAELYCDTVVNRYKLNISRKHERSGNVQNHGEHQGENTVWSLTSYNFSMYCLALLLRLCRCKSSPCEQVTLQITLSINNDDIYRKFYDREVRIKSRKKYNSSRVPKGLNILSNSREICSKTNVGVFLRCSSKAIAMKSLRETLAHKV